MHTHDRCPTSSASVERKSETDQDSTVHLLQALKVKGCYQGGGTTENLNGTNTL